jgi:DNA-directed RNA polymerase subunit omega
MIEALKSEEIVNKVGGRFKLTALIQRRLVELLHGQRALVETIAPDGRKLTDMEIVIQEILEDKIAIDYDKCDVSPVSKLTQ